MVDSIHSLFSCHRRFLRDAEPRTRRSKAQETAVAINHPEIAMAEAHDDAAALVHGEADEFACERLADENTLTGKPTSSKTRSIARRTPTQVGSMIRVSMR